MAERVDVSEGCEYQHDGTEKPKIEYMLRNPRKFKIHDTFWTKHVLYVTREKIITTTNYTCAPLRLLPHLLIERGGGKETMHSWSKKEVSC